MYILYRQLSLIPMINNCFLLLPVQLSHVLLCINRGYMALRNTALHFSAFVRSPKILAVFDSVQYDKIDWVTFICYSSQSVTLHPARAVPIPDLEQPSGNKAVEKMNKAERSYISSTSPRSTLLVNLRSIPPCLLEGDLVPVYFTLVSGHMLASGNVIWICSIC